MSAIVLFVELKLVPGERKTFLARARQHREKVLENEPGCHRFDLLTPQEDDDTVFLCEVYSDAAALEAHLDTPYMKQYREDTGPMVAGRKRTLCDLANG